MSEAKGIDRRTKVYRDLVERVPKDEKFIEEILDGTEYRYAPEPRCRVCSADDPRKNLRNGRAVKEVVELLLAAPKKVAQIHAQIAPLMEDWPAKSKITDKSIRTHLHKHMPWDRRAFRLMAEHWAAKKGLSIMDASERMMLTEEAWLQATTEMGYQNLVSGNMTPNWSEVQKAWERFSELQRQVDGEYSSVELLAELEIIIQTIREFIPPDQWATVLGRIEQKKQMANLSNKKFIDSEAEEGEIIEDFLEDIEKEQQALLSNDDIEDDLSYDKE